MASRFGNWRNWLGRNGRPGGAGRAPGGKRFCLAVEALESRDLPAVMFPADMRVRPPSGPIQPFGGPAPSGYSPAQIRHAYGFDQIKFNGGTVVGDGNGQTIAIVDAFDNPNIANDLHQFDLGLSLPDPPSFQKVNQRGGTTLPPADAGWAGEIALDVEWAHAIAPKANILLVEADDDFFSNLDTAVSYAASQPNVAVVSMSFGGAEFSDELNDDSTFLTPSGHTGVTFVASSGDNGAPVSYPAASPNVLAVGGTTLNLDSSGKYLSESAWSGSGGGLSDLEPQPAYQVGVVTQSGTQRGNPDVAYDADPNTGVSVYDSYNNNNDPSKSWEQYGGTSAGAPQWSALIAIADQGRVLNGLGTLDGPTETLPMIYGMPADNFHDITTGSSTGTPNEAAGIGYDLATGLGSPKAQLVVAALAQQTVQFQISAPAGATAGTSFMVTVTAVNPGGTTVTGYNGTVHFRSSDPQAALPADGTLTNGVGTFTVTLKTAGNQTLTATDTSSPSFTGTSAPVAVTATAANHLGVSAPANVTQGVAFNFTVTALDPYGNTDKTYAGTDHFTSSDTQAVLPADGTLTSGVGTFSATLKTVGNQTITATDTASATITGTSAAIGVVGPPAATPETVTVAQGLRTTITLYGTAALSHPVRFALTALPAHGTLSGFNANNSPFTYVTYVSDPTFAGTDSFSYTVTDTVTNLASNPAAVSVRVAAPPAANAQSVTADQSKAITLTGSTSTGNPLKFTLTSQPVHGTLSNFNGATGQVTYTPLGTYIGPDSFQFTVTDATTTLVSSAAVVGVSVPAGPVGQFGNQGVWRFSPATGTWTQLTAANTSLLASDPAGEIAGVFPGHGIWLYQLATGWKQIHPTDASALAMDAQGDIFANFPGFGVGEYVPGPGWRLLTAASAALLAADAQGDVAGAFKGNGVWLYQPATGWQQLNGVDVNLLAMNARGDIAVNFVGYGVGQYTAGGGWRLLNGTQASALAIDASADVVAQFAGVGVGEYVRGVGWRLLTAANAALLAADSLGNFYGVFAGAGVWRYDPTSGWVQVRTNDASSLVVS